MRMGFLLRLIWRSVECLLLYALLFTLYSRCFHFAEEWAGQMAAMGAAVVIATAEGESARKACMPRGNGDAKR